MGKFGEGVRVGDEPVEHHEVRGGRAVVTGERRPPAFPWHVLACPEVVAALGIVALAVWVILHLIGGL